MDAGRQMSVTRHLERLQETDAKISRIGPGERQCRDTNEHLKKEGDQLSDHPREQVTLEREKVEQKACISLQWTEVHEQFD